LFIEVAYGKETTRVNFAARGDRMIIFSIVPNSFFFFEIAPHLIPIKNLYKPLLKLCILSWAFTRARCPLYSLPTLLPIVHTGFNLSIKYIYPAIHAAIRWVHDSFYSTYTRVDLSNWIVNKVMNKLPASSANGAYIQWGCTTVGSPVTMRASESVIEMEGIRKTHPRARLSSRVYNPILTLAFLHKNRMPYDICTAETSGSSIYIYIYILYGAGRGAIEASWQCCFVSVRFRVA